MLISFFGAKHEFIELFYILVTSTDRLRIEAVHTHALSLSTGVNSERHMTRDRFLKDACTLKGLV